MKKRMSQRVGLDNLSEGMSLEEAREEAESKHLCKKEKRSSQS